MLRAIAAIILLRCSFSFLAPNPVQKTASRNHAILAKSSNASSFDLESILNDISRMFAFPKPPPTDGVLVVGASGRLGKEVVKSLLASGRNVVAAGKNDKKLRDVLREFSKDKNLWIKPNCDVTAKEIPLSYFEGITQVVSCLGPSFENPDFNSKSVDFEGNLSLLTACQKASLGARAQPIKEKILNSFNKDKMDTYDWTPLDDVIMGGQSASSWEPQDEKNDFRRWSGTLRIEGGGFCGTVVRNANFDGAGYDGIRLVVCGDGNRYKFRLKPATMENANEYQYQASFDTLDGVWTTVDLPFRSFTAVRRNDVIYEAPLVNEGPTGTQMTSIGLVLSRFEYNEWPNPKYKAGRFQLDVRTISLYRLPRPVFVLISSAGTERYNRLSEAGRAKDIPILQLNPQGILNWKYKAESAVRYSGMPYTILRPTGLVGKDSEESPRALYFAQTDTISGRITREEVAKATVFCLNSPYSTNKTFELSRAESTGEKNIQSEAQISHLLSCLVPDSDRAVRGMIPFPLALNPPNPPDKKRVEEILNDPRVKAQQTRDKGSASSS